MKKEHALNVQLAQPRLAYSKGSCTSPPTSISAAPKPDAMIIGMHLTCHSMLGTVEGCTGQELQQDCT